MLTYLLKNYLAYFITLIFIVTTAGCNSRSAYYGARQYQVNQCMKTMPESEYEDCVKQADKSYDEYKQARDEVIHPDKE